MSAVPPSITSPLAIDVPGPPRTTLAGSASPPLNLASSATAKKSRFARSTMRPAGSGIAASTSLPRLKYRNNPFELASRRSEPGANPGGIMKLFPPLRPYGDIDGDRGHCRMEGTHSTLQQAALVVSLRFGISAGAVACVRRPGCPLSLGNAHAGSGGYARAGGAYARAIRTLAVHTELRPGRAAVRRADCRRPGRRGSPPGSANPGNRLRFR